MQKRVHLHYLDSFITEHKQALVTFRSYPKTSSFVIAEGQSDLPESKYLRVENKVFYFDVGSNRRGVYLRVSEVCHLVLFYFQTDGSITLFLHTAPM